MSEESIFNVDKYLKSLSIEIIEPAQEFRIELTGIKRIFNFYEKEQTFWENSDYKNGLVKHYIDHFNECSNRIRELHENAPNFNEQQINQRWQEVKRILERKITPQAQILYFSSTPVASFLFELFQVNSQHGEAAHSFLSGVDLSTNNKQSLTGYLKAYEFEQQSSTIINRRDTEKKPLSDLRNTWNNTTEKLEMENQKFTDDLNEWKTRFEKNHEQWQGNEKKAFEKYLKSAKKKIDDLESTYTEKLSLAGPVQYWEDRVKRYKKQGKTWASLLSLVITLVTIILLLILYNIPEAFHHKVFQGEPEAIKGLIIFAVLISFSAYLVKSFSKLTFSSFHLQRDSEEREQLTKVYLALHNEGYISPDERILLLQSLFSRADTGLIGTEGSQTMPGLGSIIEKLSTK